MEVIKEEGRRREYKGREAGEGKGKRKKTKIETQKKRKNECELQHRLTSKPGCRQQPCRAAASGHTGNTHLHGVRGVELHFSEVPGRTLWTVGFPDLLIKAGHIPSVKGEDIVIALLELVIKRQAAGHGGRGHRRDELRHLLEVLDVNRVHVHVVA